MTLMSCGEMPEEMVKERTGKMNTQRLERDKQLLRRLLTLLIEEIESDYTPSTK